MRTFKSKSQTGTVTFYRPIKVFPYQSINSAIINLIQKPDFTKNCESWRDRCNFRYYGYMCDIYDGDTWDHYSEFLSVPYN